MIGQRGARSQCRDLAKSSNRFSLRTENRELRTEVESRWRSR